MFTGHSAEGHRPDFPSDFGTPRPSSAVAVAAIGTAGSIVLFGRQLLAEEEAFRGGLALAALTFLASILIATVVGRRSDAGWIGALLYALGGAVLGVALTAAILTAFS